MKPKRGVFVCNSCGAQYPKWLGRCSDCGEWNTISEEAVNVRPQVGKGDYKAKVLPISDIQNKSEARTLTGIGELDRVLGGGLVTGSLILLSGDPGIGKSTLLLQTVASLAQQNFVVLYASGEESHQQIKLRAERLGINSPNILLTNENNLDVILEAAKEIKPKVLIIDSIQTMFSPRFPSSPGSVTQIRECTNMLLEPAKGLGIATLVIGHVTKEGAVAGPKILEHLVDTVMHLEGDATSGYRILRNLKNRFGSTGEIGVFAMQGDGLVEVQNPSAFFLHDHKDAQPGSAVSVCMEGSRPILVELQALVGRSQLPMPRRFATGLDNNRLAILIAVLEKHVGLFLSSYDIYASVAGGIKLLEPTLDLALAVSLSSSLQEKSLPGRFAFFGEVGLSGCMRAAHHAVPRILEAKKMGFTRIYIPMQNYRAEKERMAAIGEDIQIYPIEHISEAAQFF